MASITTTPGTITIVVTLSDNVTVYTQNAAITDADVTGVYNAAVATLPNQFTSAGVLVPKTIPNIMKQLINNWFSLLSQQTNAYNYNQALIAFNPPKVTLTPAP